MPLSITAMPMPVPMLPVDHTAGALIGSAVYSGAFAIDGTTSCAFKGRSSDTYFTPGSLARPSSSDFGMVTASAWMWCRCADIAPPWRAIALCSASPGWSSYCTITETVSSEDILASREILAFPGAVEAVVEGACAEATETEANRAERARAERNEGMRKLQKRK